VDVVVSPVKKHAPVASYLYPGEQRSQLNISVVEAAGKLAAAEPVVVVELVVLVAGAAAGATI
jgi:hypothetical protein